MSKNFNVKCEDLGDGNSLHMINVEEIDVKLRTLMDEKIVSIYTGKQDTDIKIIKIRIKKFLDSKRDSTLEMGAIAEFFLHLYLNEIGFKQECLFQNLEEDSIKKGFDGYYSLGNEEWILESKSGNITTRDMSHQKKIDEAYSGLKDKISGKDKNDPWNNAFFHAKVVGASEDILSNIKKLSEDFTLSKFGNIKDFNIIPGSTIFLIGSWQSIDNSELLKEIKKLISEFTYKKIHVVCINKKSIDLFRDYINN